MKIKGRFRGNLAIISLVAALNYQFFVDSKESAPWHQRSESNLSNFRRAKERLFAIVDNSIVATCCSGL
ncbi:hypothetical protein TcasGA2_TC014063 [Tribolium castaneum]|uniref:Uncharacterized protein n=1 Tax=Tribolium castaneum TaxID=7070 RepID=D6WK00_TRICA|nr:hypothetical protein TcasGA2_TC014063 [Tribolium castaneum]